MITQTDCINKWGVPQNTVEWQGPKMVLWYPDTTLDSMELAEYRESCFPSRIYMNKAMHKPFTQAVKNLIKSDNLHRIKTWDGCFLIRKMKVVKNGKLGYSTKWSLHSWGIAFDIDASWNGLGKEPQIDLSIVKDIKDAGFDWGGDWKTKDGMHFQLNKI